MVGMLLRVSRLARRHHAGSFLVNLIEGGQMGHAATPNSETTERVSPESQASQATVPSQIANKSIASHQNDSELTKIVSKG